MDKLITIRPIKESDCQIMSDAFVEQGWKDKPVAQYERYLEFQNKGIRDVLIAEFNGKFAGYLTIVWESEFKDFRDNGIPEVVDFNVLKKFQRKGIGSILMDEAELRISKKSNKVGIAFGAMIDYAAAQILYVKRGYIPWGNGLTVSGRILDFGETVTVDHSLIFHLFKNL